uniref:NADH-ubiquinone oxidoreductase chain 3 n=1 Tax=Trichuris sp. LO613 TaxID=2856030 RepID=A0A8F5DRT5_9BILA|nr:NADH dehydrogenase subunit 3 [Trichuris sp. LO613]
MIMQILFIIIAMLVCMIMLSMRVILSQKNNKENLSYECGFESYKTNRLPFSLNFFLYSIIFVLFDLEIIILVAMIPSLLGLQMNVFVLGNLFLFFMLLSLVMEWYFNKLMWIF